MVIVPDFDRSLIIFFLSARVIFVDLSIATAAKLGGIVHRPEPGEAARREVRSRRREGHVQPHSTPRFVAYRTVYPCSKSFFLFHVHDEQPCVKYMLPWHDDDDLFLGSTE